MEKPSNKADAARILNLLLVENSKVSAFYAMDTNDAGFYSNTPCAIMSFNEHFYTLNCRSVEPPTLSGFLKLHATRVSRGSFGLKYQFEASFKVVGKRFYVIALDFGDRKDAIRMSNRQIAIEVFNQLQYLAAD